MKLYATLRILADSYQQIQKTRLAMEGRARAIEQGKDTDGIVSDRWVTRAQDLQDIEDGLKEEMKEEMQYHPAWPFLERVSGISFVLGAQLVGLIGDIGNFDTISKLWRFAGKGRGEYYLNPKTGRPVAPVVGKKWIGNGDNKRLVEVRPEQSEGTVIGWHRDVPISGFILSYSKRLKKLLWVIAGSLLKANSPYRKVYDEAKAYYEDNRDWTKGHRHNAALTKMEKLLLSHLWLFWRKAVNLPTRPPYVLEHTEHATMIKMEEFLKPKRL